MSAVDVLARIANGTATVEDKDLMEYASWTASPLATAIRFSKEEELDFYREPHQQLISDAIVEADLGIGKKFIAVSMPPQHGKSTLITRRTPEWFLGKYPNKKVGVCGYGANFASDWGRQIREDLKQHYDLLGWQLAEDSQKKDLWHTNQGGELWTAGILSGATGRGAHLLIMDDPVKNFQEASSPTYRERVWDEWKRTFFSRVQMDGIVIVVMTRWNIDDLAGRLLGHSKNPEGANYGDPTAWREIRLPALWESEQPITYTFGGRPGTPYDPALGSGDWTRKKGDALCPHRYSADSLNGTKNQNDEESWQCLYQQNPWKVAGGARVYHAYEEIIHEKECYRDPGLPFFWTLDFNITPMSSCYGQYREFIPTDRISIITNAKITEVEVIGEISLPQSNTPAACEEFLDRFTTLHQGMRPPVVHLYGDSAGRAGSHAGPNLSDWEIVKAFLGRYKIQFVDHVPSGAPAIRDRVNSMNNALMNANKLPRLWHDPKCKMLKNDLLNVGWKKDSSGGSTGKLDPGPNNLLTHMTDALGYMIHTKFAVRGKYGEVAGHSPR